MSNQSSAERVIRRPPMEVREASERALSKLRWHPSPSGPDSFAAVWTSRLFHFKDDLSVHLLPAKDGTRVRVKSASRVGRYDFGQNARHVRHFFEELERELQTRTEN
jgi:Protein of unknown function (DUF1499)